MFIAHLPTAYLFTLVPPIARLSRYGLLIGAVLPDLDMLRFHLLDAGQFHHHDYVTHRPAFWVALWLLAHLRCWPWKPNLSNGIIVGVLIHLGLDSIAGHIAWGWPFSTHAQALVIVPATHDWWVLSFLFHWTFAVELGLCAAAAVLWRLRVHQRCTLQGRV